MKSKKLTKKRCTNPRYSGTLYWKQHMKIKPEISLIRFTDLCTVQWSKVYSLQQKNHYMHLT